MQGNLFVYDDDHRSKNSQGPVLQLDGTAGLSSVRQRLVRGTEITVLDIDTDRLREGKILR